MQSTACGTRPSKLFHGGDADQAAEQNGTANTEHHGTTAIAAIMRGVDSTDLLCERRAGVSLGERREKVRSGLRQSSAADTI